MAAMSGCSRRSIRFTGRFSIGFVGGALMFIASAHGDEFGRLVGPPLFDVPRRADARGQTKLTVRALEALPEVLKGERAALVIATTDQGNMAKLLLSAGMRKRQDGGGKNDLVPVLIVDRFETIDGGDRMSFKARGHDLMLFEGFQVDLDTGQVVPDGFGGDIRLSAGGADGPDLTALGANKLYTFDKPLPIAPTSPGRPSSGRTVLPTDFNGRYHLMANGQISGDLELSVAEDATVSGRFRSDRNGAAYPVTGKVAADLARKIEFTIQFPRSTQTYEGLLWTEEKNAFAGTVQILDHPYSFFAVREGTSLPIGSIGPAVSTQWVAQSSPTKERLRGLSVASPRIIWASGNHGTVLRTTDGGFSWAAKGFAGAEALDFRDVHAVDEHKAYLLSIGEGEKSRIYKTVDGGIELELADDPAGSQGFPGCDRILGRRPRDRDGRPDRRPIHDPDDRRRRYTLDAIPSGRDAAGAGQRRGVRRQRDLPGRRGQEERLVWNRRGSRFSGLPIDRWWSFLDGAPHADPGRRRVLGDFLGRVPGCGPWRGGWWRLQAAGWSHSSRRPDIRWRPNLEDTFGTRSEGLSIGRGLISRIQQGRPWWRWGHRGRTPLPMTARPGSP